MGNIFKKKECKKHVWGKSYGNRKVCKKCGKVESI